LLPALANTLVAEFDKGCEVSNLRRIASQIELDALSRFEWPLFQFNIASPD
jgi:hypothetical protein